jgi:hypothetical protein
MPVEETKNCITILAYNKVKPKTLEYVARMLRHDDNEISNYGNCGLSDAVDYSHFSFLLLV